MPSRAARKPDAGNPAWRYERRRPQWTLLCQLVNEPYPRFLDLLVTQGRSLPNYVWREFDDLPKTMSVAIFEQFTAGAEEPLGNVTFLVAMHLYTHVILFSNQTHGRRTQKMRSEYRRRMLIGLAAGVPTAWVKPVVDTVLLPAHAETSGEPLKTEYFGLNLPLVAAAKSQNSNWVDHVADIVVPEAYAITIFPAGCAVVQGGLVEVTYHNQKNTRRWSGVLSENGEDGTLTQVLTTCSADGSCGTTQTAKILSVDGDNVRVSVDQCRGGSYVFDIPRGSACNLPELSDGSSCF
jgi:hypothetical protein